MYEISKSVSTVLLQQNHTYSNKATPQNSASPFAVHFFQTTTHPDCSFPFLHSYLLSPLDLELLCFLSGKSRSKRDIKWQGIMRFNKTEHKPSYWIWRKEPSIKKNVPKGCKCVRDTPPPIARSLKKLQHISRGPKLEPYRHSDCHFSFWELPKKHV